jgi:hypothetical protein
MPSENEFRYVLHGDTEKLVKRLSSLPDIVVEDIRQGDLSKGVRLRRTRASDEQETLMLAFKRAIPDDKIEIETAVSEDDFERLWPLCADIHHKTRYKFADGDLHWDVDFYGDVANPYFVRAECEAPVHVRTSPPPHPVLSDFVLYVAGKEKGFSSRRFGDPRYAKKLMKSLIARSTAVIAKTDGTTDLNEVSSSVEDDEIPVARVG